MKRSLDHLVMPTADLAVARERLTALGFTVAPDGIHPFGTANCCVYVPGGTFLEPLAVRDASAVAIAAEGGNVFVARDRLFRAAQGEEGLSALVLATGDADADHERLVAQGLSAGENLTFSRPFTDASGKSAIATFRLAFGAARGVNDGFFFTCERVGVPAVDRAALERHENGVVAIDEIALAGSSGAALLQAVSQFAGSGDPHAVTLGDCVVRTCEASDFVAAFGEALAADAPPFAAITFRTSDLRRLSDLLSSNDIRSTRIGPRLVVPAAAGQGVIFAFEEPA